MQDQKSPNFKAQSGADDHIDPLAELQRILGQDDPFKIFDKKPGNDGAKELPNLVATPQQRSEPKFQQHEAGTEHAVSVDDLEQQLKSLAKDIEINFQILPPAPAAKSESLFDDDFDVDALKQQGDLFRADSLFANDHEPVNAVLRGGIEMPSGKTQSSTADTIQMFDEIAHQYETSPVAESIMRQTERREFAPLMSDDRAEMPSVTKSLTGIGVIAAIVTTAVIGFGGLMFMSSQSNTPASGESVPVIMADNEPLKTRPQDHAATKDQSVETTLFNGHNTGDAVENSKVVVREERPMSKDELPNQPGRETLQPGTAASSDAKTAPIQPNQAAQVFGVAKKVKPLQVGPDGKIITDEASSGQMVAPAPHTNPQFIGGVRVPTARPGVAQSGGSVPPLAETVQKIESIQKPIQQKPATTVQPVQVSAGAAAPLSLNEISSQKSGAATYGVQLTAQRSEEAARAAFAELQKRFTSLKGMKANIVPIDLGDRGVYYRVRLGNFSARDDALSLCTKLKAEGGDCLVQPN